MGSSKCDSLVNRINKRLDSCIGNHEVFLTFDTDVGKLVESETAELAAKVLAFLISDIDEVTNIYKEIILQGGLQNIDAGMYKNYQEKIYPNRDHYEKIFYDLYESLYGDATSGDEDAPFDRDLWGMLASGHEFWKMDESGQYSEKDLSEVERLIYSPFFKPDEWLANLDILQPVTGKNVEKAIPSPIRSRLKELYHSFIIGNFFSSISLARSILEYALVDRSNANSIDPYFIDNRGKKMVKRLSILIEAYSEIRPGLQNNLEVIVENGNMVIHPKKKEKIAIIPVARRAIAYNTIESLRVVLEELYKR